MFNHKQYANLVKSNPAQAKRYLEKCKANRLANVGVPVAEQDRIMKANKAIDEDSIDDEEVLKKEIVKRLRANGVKAFTTWGLDKLQERDSKTQAVEVAA